jgi:hypothetical protein
MHDLIVAGQPGEGQLPDTHRMAVAAIPCRSLVSGDPAVSLARIVGRPR